MTKTTIPYPIIPGVTVKKLETVPALAHLISALQSFGPLQGDNLRAKQAGTQLAQMALNLRLPLSGTDLASLADLAAGRDFGIRADGVNRAMVELFGE